MVYITPKSPAILLHEDRSGEYLNSSLLLVATHRQSSLSLMRARTSDAAMLSSDLVGGATISTLGVITVTLSRPLWAVDIHSTPERSTSKHATPFMNLQSGWLLTFCRGTILSFSLSYQPKP